MLKNTETMNVMSNNKDESKTPQSSESTRISSYSNFSNEIMDTNELSTLRCKTRLVMQQEEGNQISEMHHLGVLTLPKQLKNEWKEEVDASKNGALNTRISFGEIFSTFVSMMFRLITVWINVKLALNFYHQGNHNYFMWTVICIVTPMFVTMLVHANMCYRDGKFEKGICQILQTLWLVLISSFLFRYWNSLIFAIKCKRAELNNNSEEQLK